MWYKFIELIANNVAEQNTLKTHEKLLKRREHNAGQSVGRKKMWRRQHDFVRQHFLAMKRESQSENKNNTVWIKRLQSSENLTTMGRQTLRNIGLTLARMIALFLWTCLHSPGAAYLCPLMAAVVFLSGPSSRRPSCVNVLQGMTPYIFLLNRSGAQLRNFTCYNSVSVRYQWWKVF